MSIKLDTKLLADFTALSTAVDWEYTLSNYVETRGSFELAVAFVNLFWPEFVERRGCIIRAVGFNEKNFEEWWATANGDRAIIERALNHLHVADIVPSDRAEVEDDVLRYLGQQISEMWRSRVAQLFPDRTFDVWFEDTDVNGEPSEASVFLLQKNAV